MLSTIDHVGVAVEDIDAALALYRDAFRMPLVHRETVNAYQSGATNLRSSDVSGRRFYSSSCDKSRSVIIVNPLEFSVSIAASGLSTMIATTGRPWGRISSG